MTQLWAAYALPAHSSIFPRPNGAKHRSGRKPGARVTNFAVGKFKVIAHGSYVALGGPH